MLDRLSPEDRKTAESEVEHASRAQSERPKRKLTLTSGQAEDSRALFVLMPFHPEMSGVYEIIRKAAQPLGLRVWRADEIASSGLITDQILEAISRSRVIVADITGKNPNVLYEIGIAHSLGKNVILIAEKGEKLPFDIVAMRVLFYEQSVAGAAKLEQALRSSLQAILDL